MHDDDFERERPALTAMAYRMLGSETEAEDIVQDAWLRVQRASPDLERPGAYLSRVVTRLCIDHMRSARVRREAYTGTWLPEPTALDDEQARSTPESRAMLAESLTMAMLVVLEELGPVERAVFVLREVFDYDYAELSAIVEKSEDACRQIARRARERVRERKARHAPTPAQRDEVMTSFVFALATGDPVEVERVLSKHCVLHSDGGGRVAAALRPVRGAARVARFFLGTARRIEGASMLVVRANGAPALAVSRDGRIESVVFAEPGEDGRVAQVYIVRNPDKLERLSRIAGS